jgi:hypothetical protein
MPERARRLAKYRSFATLSIFASAMLVSLFAPRAGFALICCALLPYLVPEAPAFGSKRASHPAPNDSQPINVVTNPGEPQ